MPGYYRCQVTIPNANGLPEDAAQNVWHYMLTEGSPSPASDAADFEAQLDEFYTAWVPSIASPDYVWGSLTTKHYDFADPLPRLPFLENSITPGSAPSSTDAYPGEVSIVLSFEGVKASGVNMRRRRGRIYCGPLSMGSGDMPTITSTNRDLIADAANAAFFDTGGTNLAVYSPYTHHGVPVGDNIKDFPDEVPANLAASFHPVVKLWVDDAWDTQRRRGRKATSRKIHTT